MTKRLAEHLPLPGSHFDGGTVAASVILNDDADTPLHWAAVLLMRSPPFYLVVECEGSEPVVRTAYENIIPAVEAYSADTGGY